MNKKKIIFSFMIMFLWFFFTNQAYAASFKIGFHFGEPNAVIICPSSHVQIGIGDIGTKTFHIHTDFILIQSKVAKNLFFYISLGGQLTSHQKEWGFAVRLPIGLTLYLTNKFDLFFQAVPVQHFVPQVSFDWQCGGGIRFRFR